MNTLKEAIEFELEHNFKVSEAIKKQCLIIADYQDGLEIDVNETGYNMYYYVDDLIFTAKNELKTA